MKNKINYENGAETKEKIITACRRLFYEKGFEETSLADISEESGVRRSLIYYHFENQKKAKSTIGMIIYSDVLGMAYTEARRYTKEHVLLSILHNYIFYHKFYTNEYYRRFVTQVCTEVIPEISYDKIDVYQPFTDNLHLNERKRKLYSIIYKGIDTQLMPYVAENLNDFDCFSLTDFTLKLSDAIRIGEKSVYTEDDFKKAKELFKKVDTSKLVYEFVSPHELSDLAQK